MNDISSAVRAELFANADEDYRIFNAGLIPGFDPSRVIGVRLPVLRKLARRLTREGLREALLDASVCEYLEEQHLLGLLISEGKDLTDVMTRAERFLPMIDNWESCDLFSPGVFGEHAAELVPRFLEWVRSDRLYTARFGIGMLLSHCLGDLFEPSHLEAAAAKCGGEYYLNMMIAWYFCEAWIKQREAVVPYYMEERLPWPVLRMAIQKCVESRRVSAEDKALLRGLRAELKKRAK